MAGFLDHCGGWLLKIACIGQQCSGKTTLVKFFAKEFKNVYFVKLADPIYNAIQGLKQPKHRAFMQQFGTLAKKHFGTEIFAKVLYQRVKELETEISNMVAVDAIDSEDTVILNDDVRFGYELEYMKRLGF